jgi:hypothetical protein
MQKEKCIDCSCHQATTSTAVCKRFDQKPSSHSQDSEIVDLSNFDLQDHNYCGTGESEVFSYLCLFFVQYRYSYILCLILLSYFFKR